jgi:hypothetical protein
MVGQVVAITARPPPRRRHGWRRKLLVLVSVVVVVCVGVAIYADLTQPQPFPPSRSMVIGTWRSATGAVLLLRPDGTFTGRSLPADFGASPSAVPSSGSGHWHVGPVPAEPAGVVFNFSKKLWVELLVERMGSMVVMYYDKGDPDEGVSGQYQFTKTQ